ncbi:MAG: SDR family oxidoreductase [Limnohabitans sp.]|jgi:3-oxoacyl-[acyl-carrier protein] reductase|nr:SDR family oxidoreductase [Limnohabitans sp.]
MPSPRPRSKTGPATKPLPSAAKSAAPLTSKAASPRVALITGAAVGIGAAIAKRLAQDGLHVIVSDRDLKAATKTANAIQKTGGLATPLELDVGSAESIAAAFAQVGKTFKRCDVLVNNAGIAKTYPFIDFPLDNWNATMNINLTGTLLCSQHAARLMRKRRWGRIISIASVAGMRAVGSGRTAYGTSKAAVIGLMRQIAAELTVEGITANAIAPGPVDTPLTQVLHSPAFRKAYTAAIPAGRYGLTTEIAAMAAFLASDQAAYVSGAAIPVDGGFYAAGARGV